ncbi:MAG TPA: ribulose-phosphate 3-epimerase [Anaerolineales bacterium]|nr:ribulose-phosphate 3-epimerase [Anaerolineales bacterium]
MAPRRHDRHLTLVMTNKYVIAPSILSADFTRLGEEIRLCESAGADWIHVDVMDGHFVPNITMGPVVVEACRRVTELPLDVHLMIEKPERHLEAFAKAGASRLTVHVETCPDLDRTLEQIKSLGCRAGVVLNPETPVGAIESVLPLADLVLVMSVHPGFSGQEFISGSIAKAAEVRTKLDALGSSAWLEVDGGINAETLPKMKAAGATAFVAASAVFSHPQGPVAGIEKLRNVIARSGASRHSSQ